MKRLISILACGAGILLLAATARAQTGSISGKIQTQDGQPIEGAVIRLTHPENKGLSYRGKSNKKGDYILITGQTSGPWRLTVTKEGFAEYECPDLIRVPLGDAPLQFPAIKLWTLDTPGVPIKVTPEEVDKIEAQRQEFLAIKAAFDQAVKMVDDADAALKAGDRATHDQKVVEAEAAYGALVEKVPDVAEVHFNLGLVKKRLQKWPEAAAEYLKAAELRPDMLEAYHGAAECYQKAGQMDKAAELLGKAATEHPESPALQLLLGKVLWNSGQYPPAAAALTKARDLNPADPEPLYYLGMIAVGEGRVAECVKLLNQYLAMNPQDAEKVSQAKQLIQALKK